MALALPLGAPRAAAQQETAPVEGAKAAKPPKKKPPPPPPPPAPVAAPAESTLIEPRLTYRASALQTNRDSVYWKEGQYGNTADQLYATVRFTRTYDYRHDVVIEPTFRTIRDKPSQMDAIVLEQAYVDSAVWRNLSLTAGKKTEYAGSGFMVNPSDLLNEDKDLFDTLYQQEGKVFTRLRYKWEPLTLALGFVPRRGAEAKEGRGWLTASSNVADADLGLQVMHHETDKTTTGLSASRYFGDRVELHWDGRYQTRQRSPGDPGNTWIRFSAYEQEDPSGFYLAGSRLVVTPRRTVILEGIQQQSGLAPDERKAFFAYLRSEKENYNRVEEIPTRLQGRRYAFVSYQDDDTIKGTHLGASYLRNLLDDSYFTTASVVYHLSPISSVEVNTMLFKGSAESEFGSMPFPRTTHLIIRGKF